MPWQTRQHGRRRKFFYRLRRDWVGYRSTLFEALLLGGVMSALVVLVLKPAFEQRELWHRNLGDVVAVAQGNTVAAEEPSSPVGPRLGATVSAQREIPALTVPERLAVTRNLPEDTPLVPTWLRNAVPVPPPDARPAIAIVIDDVGLNRPRTRAVMELRGPLTLGFMPYSGALGRQTEAARAAGHELLLHLPMEPTGEQSPGPEALLVRLDRPEFLARLRAQLRSFSGYVGVNNHMGSLLTTDRERMAWVMNELRARQLLFLDSRTTAETVAADEARRAGVPVAQRDVFLDNEHGVADILRQLALVERVATRKGYAIAIGHPHEATIAALRQWLPTLEARGFALVPVSAIVARRACAEGVLRIPSVCGRDVVAAAPLVQ